MFEGWFVQKTISVDEFMPYAPYPVYPSGLVPNNSGIYRYTLQNSDYPTLLIIDPIFDKNRNYIAPGHYELALSDDRSFLILMQQKNPIAIIPVFKFEEEEVKIDQLRDKKALKKQKKKEKEEAKIRAKYARKGATFPEKELYMNAEIEYVQEGDYYLLKYERDRIRAWGAIKR